MSLLVSVVILFTVLSGQNINEFIENEMLKAHIAALSVVVVKNSTILFSNAYGLSNPNKTHALINNTNSTIFNVASISKTITSFGIMSLYDKGLLKLDDNINNYLPFPIVNPYYANDKITIRMLMTHTSSISDTNYDTQIYPLVLCIGDSNISLSQFIYDMFNKNGKYYNNQSWHIYPPGINWDYSNIGATLAGYIAECIINDNKEQLTYYSYDYVTFDQYVLDNIWSPMKTVNIQHIGFHLNDFSYNTDDNIFAIPSSWNDVKQEYITYCLYGYPDYPDGLWRSSALNYQPLLSTFINGGISSEGVRILNESTVNEMKTVQVIPTPGIPLKTGQGLLFYTIYQNERQMLGHSGGDDGVCCDAFFNPMSGVGYIILGNCDWNIPVTLAFREIERELLEIYDPNGKINQCHKCNHHKINHLRKHRMHNNTVDAVCGLPYN